MVAVEVYWTEHVDGENGSEVGGTRVQGEPVNVPVVPVANSTENSTVPVGAVSPVIPTLTWTYAVQVVGVPVLTGFGLQSIFTIVGSPVTMKVVCPWLGA